MDRRIPRNPIQDRSADPPEDDRPGPYDADPDESDLWFLPDVAAGVDDGPPLPRAAGRAALDPAEWQAAQGALSQDLAALAYDHGRLAERMAAAGPGAMARLAQAEALSLGWANGDRIAADRLALWLSLRVGATGDDAEALARVAWSARRLAAPGVERAGGEIPLAAHLGSVADRLAPHLDEAEAALQPLATLHPVTRGCAALHLWRGFSDRPAHLAAVEGAVLGMRIAAGRAGCGFLPLTLAGPTALTRDGSAERRLAGWISGAHQAVLAALLSLDRVCAWRARADSATADLSGRVPGLLIGCLVRQPMITVPLAAQETGASRAAAQRNLAAFAERGLIREVTGQGRFRVWTARL